MAKTPYRLYVLQKLTDHLAGITVADGYEHDLTGKVHRGVAVFTADSNQWPLPLLSILESPKPGNASFTGEDYSERAETWELLVQGWTNDDIDNPTDNAHWLMADVESRLGLLNGEDEYGRSYSPEYHLLGDHPDGSGKLIAGITFGPGVVRPPTDHVSSKAFFYLPVRIMLAYDSGQPYINA